MSDMPLPPETPILTGRKLSGRYVLKTLISLRKTTQIWEADDLVLTRKVILWNYLLIFLIKYFFHYLR